MSDPEDLGVELVKYWIDEDKDLLIREGEVDPLTEVVQDLPPPAGLRRTAGLYAHGG